MGIGEEVPDTVPPAAESAERGLTVDCELADGGTIVCRVAGDIDLDSRESLGTALEALLTAKAPAVVVVDLADTGFCDSSGLNLLLQFRLKAQDAGIALHLAAVPPNLARIFEITGADTVFSIHATTDDALTVPPSA